MKPEPEDTFRIGIRFGDNDFSNTFMALFHLLEYSVFLLARMNKKTLVSLINESVWAAYIVGQWRFEMWEGVGAPLKEEKARLTDYLQITEDRLYLNEEMDTYLQTQSIGCFNNDFFIMDMRLPREQRFFSC